jgi:hypothetical protein
VSSGKVGSEKTNDSGIVKDYFDNNSLKSKLKVFHYSQWWLVVAKHQWSIGKLQHKITLNALNSHNNEQLQNRAPTISTQQPIKNYAEPL